MQSFFFLSPTYFLLYNQLTIKSRRLSQYNLNHNLSHYDRLTLYARVLNCGDGILT